MPSTAPRGHRKGASMLAESGYDGVLSMECEGQGGPMIEKSLAWLRKALNEFRPGDSRIAGLDNL